MAKASSFDEEAFLWLLYGAVWYAVSKRHFVPRVSMIQVQYAARPTICCLLSFCEIAGKKGERSMLDPELAVQLKQAGLEWQPKKRDNFMVPGGELTNEIFTINDQTILVEMVKGQVTVTFHGSAEWALDDVLLADVVWLPSETQLREAIQLRTGGDTAAVTLRWSLLGYQCTLMHQEQEHVFQGAIAEVAYAQALLFLLKREQNLRGGQWVNAA
jgi:hypothetical protein